MAFKFEKTKLPGVIIIEPQVFGDSRGYFMETFKKNLFAEAGIDREFVQDNESSSTKVFCGGCISRRSIRRGNWCG